MCVDNDSYPPITPIAGGSTGRDLRLTSADGTRFMAYESRATNPTGAGMIVIPDVRGLHSYYKALADRFAEIGVDSIAFDFFARTAQTDDRSDAFPFLEHVPLTKPETLQAASGLGYAGVIGFYGWPLGLKRWPDRPKPIDAASQYKAPVLSIYGGADEGIPEADRQAFAAALQKARVKHEEHVYPGA